MKSIEFFKVIFVSYEALFLCIIAAIYFYYPVFFVVIGQTFQTNNEIWKFIPSVPFVVCGFSIQYAWKILMPLGSSSNRVLHEWPNYWKLKLRVIISVLFCVTYVLGAIFIWFFSSIFSALNIGAIFIASIVVALAVAFNQFLAAIKIRELMEP